MIDRRTLLAGLAATAIVAPHAAQAQDWPARPVTLIVPSSPGGSTDALARQLAEALSADLKQPVEVKNVTGAGGSIGMGQLARSKPDGYTLGFAWTSLIVSTLVRKEQLYDPIKDFSPVGLVAGNVNVMVTTADHPAKSLPEMIEYAKTHKVTYGSFGLGTMTNLNTEQMAKLAGVKFTHVPYPGTAPAQVDLLGGRIDFMFDTVSQIKPQIEAGKLRALGTTGVKRHPLIPDVPTISETLPDYKFLGWFGVVGPANLPPEIVETLHASIERVTKAEAYQARLARDGFDPASGTPEEITARMEQDLKTWGEVITWAGIEKQ